MKLSLADRRLGWAILALLLAAPGPGAWAQPIYNALTSCAYGTETRSTTPFSASSACSGADPFDTPDRTIDGAAAAALSGTLHAEASGQGLGTSALALASYYDDVRSLVTGMNGLAGTVAVTTFYEGGTFVPGTIGMMELLDSRGGQAAHQDFTGQVLFLSGKSTEILPVVFGQTFGLGSVLRIRLDSPGAINFADTTEVIGLQAYDDQGHPVAASFVDDAGVDWGALATANAAAVESISAVPEEGTLPLLAVGFAALGLALRRRTSRRAGR